MALLDIFKKKKKQETEKKSEKKEAKKEIKKKPVKKGKVKLPKETKVRPSQVRTEKPAEVRVQPKKSFEGAYRILYSPHITEKATDLGKENKYVFKVWQKSNKTEVKKSIEDTYGVDVEDVKIINIHKKRKRLGRQRGWKKGYKKAIVKIKEGQKIEILPR